MPLSSPLARMARRRRARLALASCLAALVLPVPLAWASHQFTDVPTGSLFHADIGAVKDAGITSG